MIELKNNPTGNFFLLAGPCVIEGEEMPISRIASSGWNLTSTFPMSNTMFLIIYFFSYNPASLPTKSISIRYT